MSGAADWRQPAWTAAAALTVTGGPPDQVFVLMQELEDRGWVLPGEAVGRRETPAAAALRALSQAGAAVGRAAVFPLPARDGERAAGAVVIPVLVKLGSSPRGTCLPPPAGKLAWVPLSGPAEPEKWIAVHRGGRVCGAQLAILAQVAGAVQAVPAGRGWVTARAGCGQGAAGRAEAGGGPGGGR